MWDLIFKIGSWLIDKLIKKEADKARYRENLRAFVREWQTGNGPAKIRQSFRKMRKAYRDEERG